MKYILIFCGVLIIGVVLALGYCTGGSSIREIERVTSPDNKFDGVSTIESYGGAAGSVRYEVYIVKTGKRDSYKSKERVFDAVAVKGLRLSWIDNDIIEIKYDKARILEYRNNMSYYDNDKIQYIEIRETPLSNSPSFDH